MTAPVHPSRVFCIVQARRRSTRLPDKTLMTMAGRPMLHWVMARVARIPGLTEACCAIPEDPWNAPLAPIAEATGARVVRGPEADVLHRYRLAADAMGATDEDLILRVTSDCPLIDPDVCALAIAEQRRLGVGYLALKRATWPHGLDCEVFPVEALRRADARATTNEEREHVSPWISDSGHYETGYLAGPRPESAVQRWTVDTREDFDFVAEVLSRLTDPLTAGWEDILALLSQDPVLMARGARTVP
jgi:glutamate-1-semialdehyde 2,1-aminomutase/spore coat polysaccharide biosynthesis protein SpsF